MTKSFLRFTIARDGERGLNAPPAIATLAMMRADREARLQRAKAIGRAAYRIVRVSKVEGYIDLEDGRKLPANATAAASLSCIRCGAPTSALERLLTPHVSYAGRRVLVIQRNGGGVFKALTFEPGDWQQKLRILGDAGLVR